MAQAAETYTTNPPYADRARTTISEEWARDKSTLAPLAANVDRLGRNANDGDEWREMADLEVAVLKGAIVAPADADAREVRRKPFMDTVQALSVSAATCAIRARALEIPHDGVFVDLADGNALDGRLLVQILAGLL